MEQNMKKAHEYCAYAAGCGVLPLAPHTTLTNYLDDNKPKEREQGFQMKLELLKRCDEVWVCGSEISQDMRGEIELARAEEIPTLYVSDSFVRSNYKIRHNDAPLTIDDCIPDSDRMNYENQIIVLNPDAYGVSGVTADDSLWIPYNGNGCTFGAIGRAVYAESLLSGKHVHWERQDFLGIVEPLRLMEWVGDKPVRNKLAFEIIRSAEWDVSDILDYNRDEGLDDDLEI